MGNIGNNMLIGADTGGQNFRNVIVGNRREAPVNGPGRIGVPLVADWTKGHDKGKGPIFIIEQVAAVITRFNTTKGKCYTTGKADGKNNRCI